MKKQSSLASALILCLSISIFGQSTTPTPTPAPTPPTQPTQTQQTNTDDEDVVRISTNLVQVDVVVTDKSNRQVTDLRPEDFEIYEDGRLQNITNFSYIAIQPAAQTATTTPTVDKNAPPVPPVRLRPEQVRRTIALVVDDLGLSFESTAYVRQALKKFVDQQMQPGDLVAIIRTGGGIGALQQFTSDKRQLYAAIERVRWNMLGRGGISTFAPIDSSTQTTRDQDDSRSVGGEDIDEFREELFAVGTLGALNYVIRGLRELPGRKSVVLLSDSLPIFNSAGRSDRILESIRRLADLANRASVVIYTIDARGLQTLGLTAADDTSNLTPDQVSAQLSNRRARFFESQNGLNYLAQQTGGLFVRNTNDISRGINRVLEDQKGFYLIGYRPDDSTFDPATGRRSFHKWSVKVKRAGLKARTRTGFYGFTDEETRTVRRTPHDQILGALTSPFGAAGVHLRLTSLFGNEEGAGSFMRSLVHIDVRDLTFTEEAEGWHKAAIDVVAITFGDNGRVVDEVNRTQTLRARGDTYKYIVQNGLTFHMNVPIKKPGAYQLRIAVRDTVSERVGSASQFIEVPNLEKQRLALSGIVLSIMNPSNVDQTSSANTSTNTSANTHITANANTSAASSTTSSAQQNANNTESSTDAFDSLNDAAVRRVRPGMDILFGYMIYSARLDRATRRPQLQTQVRLFRDGQQIYAGSMQNYDATQATDLKRLAAGGRIRLPPTMPPGEYVLQIIVIDALAKDKYRTATQWIDFEIVK